MNIHYVLNVNCVCLNCSLTNPSLEDLIFLGVMTNW